ncbi:hypothetical protein [Pseudomonas helvetica]|uniref:hypothetical protein n=1 Tax=Pseudomonas helvetica TaxID=3136738 RepID=UPI0032668721
MKGFSALFGGFLAISTSLCFAADLKFEDFKVAEVFTGQNHALLPVENSSPLWDEYRAQAITRKVNFAGHYIVHTMGCGGGTICGEVLDARTGAVVASLPNAYYMVGREGNDGGEGEGGYFDINFKPDSNLMMVLGVAADTEVDVSGKPMVSGNRVRYYEFTNNDFRLLKVEGS